MNPGSEDVYRFNEVRPTPDKAALTVSSLAGSVLEK